MDTHHTDYLVIGAGPSGLQLGYFLSRDKRDYLILEKADTVGSFFQTYPRHRTLISINKLHTGLERLDTNLRWDWNSLLSEEHEPSFSQYSKRYYPDADDLARYLADFSRRHELAVRLNTEVTRVSKENGQFMATDIHGNVYVARRLIIATGLSTPYCPDIPGLEHCDSYADHSIDPKDYTNKRVLVIGKGNSAFETANNLIETAATIHICSPDSLRFAWDTHFVGHLRSINASFIDTYHLKSQNALIDGKIKKIEKAANKYKVYISYCHAANQTVEILYDHVIACAGFRFDASMFDENSRPQLAIHDKLPSQTTEWESTDISDLYFAGTLMQACDYKKTMSGFIHGFRYNVKALAQLFAQKYHNASWPYESIDTSPDAILHKMIDRLNCGPGIFLQPGFLCDLVVLTDGSGRAQYYKDIRHDYALNSEYFRSTHWYTVTLEYGESQKNPFHIERDPSPDAGYNAAYLHPVIRRYSISELVATHHINDDLENQWDQAIYVDPALSFLKEQLAFGWVDRKYSNYSDISEAAQE